jgi:putative transposase
LTEEIPSKKSRFTDSQIIAILKQTEAGTPVPELCREHGISSAHLLQVAIEVWRHGSFHGLAHEGVGGRDRRLKKMYAEAQMSADIMKEALSKKW